MSVATQDNCDQLIEEFKINGFIVLEDFISTDILFLHTTSEHGRQPAGWTRTEGKGRVCVLTPGHNLAIWHHPSYQAILRNSLKWCLNA